MTSNRPYLLRAFNEWILDNEFTPHIVVEADMPHVHVPPQTIKDGQVVPGNVMKVTLSLDHRAADGAGGAAFLQSVKGFLENPVTMLV